MIILTPRGSAYEAARAMADNNVGAILIAEEQRVVGIATDRDLALEAVAGDLDARATSLRDVMTDEVATADIGASIQDVVRTMCAHACRRVPVTENGKPVGLVTLDDLLIEREIDLEAARSIILHQLEIAARFKPEGSVHPEQVARPESGRARARAVSRRKARAENAYVRLLKAVERHTGLSPRERAESALGIVLGALCRRVTPQEARHLVAQLPSVLHTSLEAHLDGPDRRITVQSIEAELVRQLHIDADAASMLLGAVCDAIADSVSGGEIEAFRGQLPLGMKDLFPPTPVRRTG